MKTLILSFFALFAITFTLIADTSESVEKDFASIYLVIEGKPVLLHDDVESFSWDKNGIVTVILSDDTEVVVDQPHVITK